jgi:UDP-glucose 4-epimerase
MNEKIPAVLVLGGGGFIGANLCEELISAGYKVRVFEHPRVQSQCSPKVLSQVEWFEGDFTNPAEIDTAMQGCEVVFHLVSTTLPKTSNENPVYDIESNLVSTIRMLESACRHGLRKVIFASSGGTVYGIPRNLPISETHPTEPIASYGITKLAVEKYLHLFFTLHGLDYCILRLANPYGQRQRVVSSQGAVAVFLHKAMRDETIEIWGDGSVTRDYIHISDVVSAMVCAIQYAGEQRIFNIGSGIGLSLNELLEQIECAMCRPVRRSYLPGRQFDVPVNVLNIDRAKEFLCWQPRISIADGIRKTLSWMGQP